MSKGDFFRGPSNLSQRVAEAIDAGPFMFGGTSTSFGNQYSITPTIPISRLLSGEVFYFIANAANSGTPTLVIKHPITGATVVSSQTIKLADGSTNVPALGIINGRPVFVMWDGTNYRMLFSGYGGDLTGDDETYGAGWNEDLTFPTKNAVYDKIEALISDAAYGSGWNGVTGAAPSKNAVYDQIQALLGLIPSFGAGTYIPTLTNVANLDGSTAYVNMYLELHTRMLVVGIADVNPTAATATQLGISLPTASNFAAVTDCIGLAASPAVTQCGGIYADTTNKRAELLFNATDTSNRSIFYAFMYRLI